MTKQYIKPSVQIMSMASLSLMQSASPAGNSMEVHTTITNDQW